MEQKATEEMLEYAIPKSIKLRDLLKKYEVMDESLESERKPGIPHKSKDLNKLERKINTEIIRVWKNRRKPSEDN